MGIFRISSNYLLLKKSQYSPSLQQHQGFQYHQEVPEGRQHLGVPQDLLDQEDQVDPTYWTRCSFIRKHLIFNNSSNKRPSRSNSYHLTNISSFTLLTSWTRQALRRIHTTSSCPLLITNTKSLWISLDSTHLQTNWTRRSRESSGSFVSFLAEKTLLASGTGLTISTLKRWQSKDTSVKNTITEFP